VCQFWIYNFTLKNNKRKNILSTWISIFCWNHHHGRELRLLLNLILSEYEKIIITKRIRHGYKPLWRVCHGCFCVSNIWGFFCQQNILSSILISKFQYSNNLGQHTLYRNTKITGLKIKDFKHLTTCMYTFTLKSSWGKTNINEKS